MPNASMLMCSGTLLNLPLLVDFPAGTEFSLVSSDRLVDVCPWSTVFSEAIVEPELPLMPLMDCSGCKSSMDNISAPSLTDAVRVDPSKVLDMPLAASVGAFNNQPDAVAAEF